LRLLGISTVHGNSSLANTTANAGSVLEAIGRPEVPVYPGAKKPFSRAAVHALDIHGASGLDGTELLPKASIPPVTDESPILAMRNALLAEPKGTPWVVATGTLTNVALLFATFPEVSEHIQGLNIMGGAVGNGFTAVPISHLPGSEARIGNRTIWAEFNIYCDPEAAQSLLSNPVLIPKTTLITLDLTHQVLADDTVQSRILNCPPLTSTSCSTLRRILHDLLIFFADKYKAVFGLDKGPPLHDPLAVAVIVSNLNPHFAAASPSHTLRFENSGNERFLVSVETNGLHGSDVSITGQLGRTLVKPVDGHGTVIPRGVDVVGFWNLIIACVERADLANEARNTKRSNV
jgi:uridine nucleosidase